MAESQQVYPGATWESALIGTESSLIAWACLGRCQTSWLVRRTGTGECAWPLTEESRTNKVMSAPIGQASCLIARALAVI